MGGSELLQKADPQNMRLDEEHPCRHHWQMHSVTAQAPLLRMRELLEPGADAIAVLVTQARRMRGHPCANCISPSVNFSSPGFNQNTSELCMAAGSQVLDLEPRGRLIGSWLKYAMKQSSLLPDCRWSSMFSSQKSRLLLGNKLR